MMIDFNERFEDWLDFDVASYEIGVSLGFFKDYRKEGGSIFDHADKHIFWSNNPLGNFFSDVLTEMVNLGKLETDDDGRFRKCTEKISDTCQE